MILKTEAELAKQIKTGEPARVYLFYGGDNYLKTAYLQSLEKMGEKRRLWDTVERFDGKKLNLDEFGDKVEPVPLSGSMRLVLVEDFEPEKLAASDMQRLLDLLQDPPPYCVIVFLIRNEEYHPEKTAKGKKLLAAVDQSGVCCALNPRTRSDLAKFVRGNADKMGCIIYDDAAAALIERCGGDIGMIKNELNKLCNYKPGGTIVQADIDKLCTGVVEASVFDLAKLILREDYAGAMNNLSELLYLKEQPTMILAALSGAFLDLYRAKTAKLAGVEVTQVAKDLGYGGRDFRIKNAFRDQGHYSLEYLRRVIELLSRADCTLKSSKVDDRVVVEEVITEIFMLNKKG